MTTALTAQTQDDKLGLWSEETYGRIKKQAEDFFKSGLAPSRFQNPLQVIAAASFGREMGLTFTESLKHIHVIEGIPALDASMQLAMVRARCKGAKIRIIEQTKTACRISAWRPEDGDQEPEIFSYTHEEVPPFYFTGIPGSMKPKANWINHEPDMLFARCATRMIRRKFSDVVTSAYTPEELWESQDAKIAVEAGVAEASPEQATKTGATPSMPRRGAPGANPAAPEIEEAQIVEEAKPAPVLDGVDPEAPSETAKAAVDLVDQEAIMELIGAFQVTTKRDTTEHTYNTWREQQNKSNATPETILHGYEVYTKRLAELPATPSN